MPFTVEEFHDLVRLLEEHPQWRAELRRLLLTEELLELPALVREWVEAQREFEARTEERLGNLEVRLMEFEARTEERFQALAEEVRELARAQREFEARMEERLENLEVRVGNLEVRLMEFEARTEERFQALVEEVRKLAEAQREFEVRTEERLGNLEVRVGNLEVRLIEFEARTEERFRALAEEVRELARVHKEFEVRTEERFQTLTERIDSLTVEVRELAQQVRGLLEWQRGEAGRREGERYERNLVRQAVTLFSGGAGGTAEDPRVQRRLSRWLRKVVEGERFLNPDEDPALADLIWWKRQRVLVVEASLKVNGEDVMRAFKRARTLQSAGVEAIGVVVGRDWASLEARELAKEKGVWWLVGGIPSEELVEFRRLED